MSQINNKNNDSKEFNIKTDSPNKNKNKHFFGENNNNKFNNSQNKFNNGNKPGKFTKRPKAF